MDVSTLAYIQEQVSEPADYKTNFGYTIHDRKDRFFLTFDAILQSFGVMNRNNRMYDADNIMDRIDNDPCIQSLLKHNCWIGELDHPISPVAGQEISISRLASPDPKRSSHYIRSPKLNGNLLEAHIQTDSSNEHGMNLAIKIVDGKIIPGFSVRVIGGLSKQGNIPKIVVRKVICYDAVLYPSHAEAVGKLSQPMMESIDTIEKYSGAKVIPFKELAKQAAKGSDETKWLMESFGLTEENLLGVTGSGNSIVITENSNIYLQPITDRNIRKNTRSILNDWIMG